MNTQTIINIALGLAVAFLLWANQGQGLILADLSTKLALNTFDDALRESEKGKEDYSSQQICSLREMQKCPNGSDACNLLALKYCEEQTYPKSEIANPFGDTPTD